MGKKKKKKLIGDSPQETVKLLMKAGKIKKKCCKSRPRCKKCPVRALATAKEKHDKAERKAKKAA